MGKLDDQLRLPSQQRREGGSGGGSISCGWWDWVRGALSLKCAVFTVLSLGVFLSAAFWLLPRDTGGYGFDAKAEVKSSAAIQGSFILDVPVSLLIPHIRRLEYDITGEVGVPYSKVAILSMHKAVLSNHTNVVFGVLPDPINKQLDPLSLILLRSSLIELFLQESNLTFSTVSVGQPSRFEILKFPGNLTVIPLQSAALWQIQQTLFNFTLNNSISEVQEYFVQFRDQLKQGLRLTSYENVYVQITNEKGSTIDKPVTVQVAIMSDWGIILPQRLKQLAQTIKHSAPSKNLGLNHTVFGKVKEVSLSSHMTGDLQPYPPTASPAPAPGQDNAPSSSPSPLPTPPSLSPSPSPAIHSAPPPSPSLKKPLHPCPDAEPGFKPSPAPGPQLVPNIPSASPPRTAPPVRTSPPPLPLALSPLPSVSLGSNPSQGDQRGSSPSYGPAPNTQASAGSPIRPDLSFYSILMVSLLYWYFQFNI
uniref:DUF7036 domain-containing protein n=2 Tax=Kalanchoe fedtschenkoi TaxID=63787 RepID=A0A7N0TW91_KALFE